MALAKIDNITNYIQLNQFIAGLSTEESVAVVQGLGPNIFGILSNIPLSDWNKKRNPLTAFFAALEEDKRVAILSAIQPVIDPLLEGELPLSLMKLMPESSQLEVLESFSDRALGMIVNSGQFAAVDRSVQLFLKEKQSLIEGKHILPLFKKGSKSRLFEVLIDLDKNQLASLLKAFPLDEILKLLKEEHRLVFVQNIEAESLVIQKFKTLNLALNYLPNHKAQVIEKINLAHLSCESLDNILEILPLIPENQRLDYWIREAKHTSCQQPDILSEILQLLDKKSQNQLLSILISNKAGYLGAITSDNITDFLERLPLEHRFAFFKKYNRGFLYLDAKPIAELIALFPLEQHADIMRHLDLHCSIKARLTSWLFHSDEDTAVISEQEKRGWRELFNVLSHSSAACGYLIQKLGRYCLKVFEPGFFGEILNKMDLHRGMVFLKKISTYQKAFHPNAQDHGLIYSLYAMIGELTEDMEKNNYKFFVLKETREMLESHPHVFDEKKLQGLLIFVQELCERKRGPFGIFRPKSAEKFDQLFLKYQFKLNDNLQPSKASIDILIKMAEERHRIENSSYDHPDDWRFKAIPIGDLISDLILHFDENLLRVIDQWKHTSSRVFGACGQLNYSLITEHRRQNCLSFFAGKPKSQDCIDTICEELAVEDKSSNAGFDREKVDLSL